MAYVYLSNLPLLTPFRKITFWGWNILNMDPAEIGIIPKLVEASEKME